MSQPQVRAASRDALGGEGGRESTVSDLHSLHYTQSPVTQSLLKAIARFLSDDEFCYLQERLNYSAIILYLERIDMIKHAVTNQALPLKLEALKKILHL